MLSDQIEAANVDRLTAYRVSTSSQGVADCAHAGAWVET